MKVRTSFKYFSVENCMKLLRWQLKSYVARAHTHIRGQRIYTSPAVNELMSIVMKYAN